MKEIVTYLMFDGNCREAMTFYAAALKGEAHMMTVGESGQTTGPEGDRIMHCRLKMPHGTLMASDTMTSPPYQLCQGNNFSISLDCDTIEEQQSFFDALKEGGKITMPLQDTFWSARFGMLIDKFGISWMFNYDKPKA